MIILVLVQKIANGQLEREVDPEFMLQVVAIEEADEFDGRHADGGRGGQERRSCVGVSSALLVLFRHFTVWSHSNLSIRSTVASIAPQVSQIVEILLLE